MSARVKTLRDLEGPVFHIERAHHFAEIEKGIDKMKSLTGPMYEIDRKHNYSEIEKRCEKLQRLEGPVYNTDAVKHQFNEITQRMESIKNITYPCVQDDHKHHFNGMFLLNMYMLLSHDTYKEKVNIKCWSLDLDQMAILKCSNSKLCLWFSHFCSVCQSLLV